MVHTTFQLACGINQVFYFLYLDALNSGALLTVERLPLPELANSQR